MKLSKEERERFYWGMDNSEAVLPELIARSSTFPFQEYTKSSQDKPEEWMMERNTRTISTIGNHKIRAVYDSKLRAKVRDILSEIPWRTIDIVRVGCKDDDNHPPVVLITAAASEVHDEDAQNAVDEIHKLMLEYVPLKLPLPLQVSNYSRNDLGDVHAEMKTGEVFELETYNNRRRYPLELVRVPKMGYSISNEDLTSAGSICLYLKIDGVDFALTCQHVVLSSPEEFNGKAVILQPSKQDLEDDEIVLNEHIAETQTWLDKYEANKLKFEKGEGPRPKATKDTVKMVQDDLTGYRVEKTAMESSKAEVSLPFGTVTYAPGISPHPTTNFRRDWALIKLSEDRFQSLPPNIVS